MLPTVPTTVNEVHSKAGLLTYNKRPKSLLTTSRSLQSITQQETVTHCLLFILQPICLHNSAHVFTANHITRLPIATLCIALLDVLSFMERVDKG